jgi:hypothetical protein
MRSANGLLVIWLRRSRADRGPARKAPGRLAVVGAAPIGPLSRDPGGPRPGARGADGAAGDAQTAVVSLQRLRRINPAIARALRLVSFLQPTPALVDELNTFEPTIPATYPSAAVMLAEERQAGRLRFAPAEVWTGRETLSAAMRAYIADVFGCVVVNRHGASEFLTLACECRCGCLHLNSDWAVLEAVDADGRPDRMLLSTARAGDAGEHALRRARRSLAAFLASQGAAQVHIECRSAAPDVRGPSGKVQRVVARVQ